MSFYTYLCANFLFPLHEKLKGHKSLAIKAQLEESQWRRFDEISTETEQRLSGFLGKCYENVP